MTNKDAQDRGALTAPILPEEFRNEQRERSERVGTIALVAITLALVFVTVRVGQLQMAPGEPIESRMSDRATGRAELARRGQILDRRGRTLAATRAGRRLFVDPMHFPKPYDESIVGLCAALSLDTDLVGSRIMRAISENHARRGSDRALIRYVRIPGVLNDRQIAKTSGLGMPGVHLERVRVREAPSGVALSAIVGKVGIDHNGLLGAEYAFEGALEESRGEITYIHDARGRPLWLNASGREAARPGEDLRLSIDLVLQEIAIEELERGMDDADAAGGRLIAMDPASGEILAMVDLIRDLGLPRLGSTPASPDGASKTARYDPEVRYATIPEDPRRLAHPSLGRNRCVEDVYEPGSTFKPYLWSVVTELGLAQAHEEFDTEGGFWRTDYGRPIKDVVQLKRQSWLDVLVNSSNIGMIKGVDRLSHRQTQEAIRRFGFGSPSGVGLPGEAAGLVTSSAKWSKYTQTSVSFGYEVAVTPVQMIRAFSTFARPSDLVGTMATIRLTASPSDDPWKRMVHRVLPAWTADLAKAGMEQVGAKVDRKLDEAGVIDRDALRYDIFGKSGTARVPRPDGGGYFENQYFSSFVAGAPVHEPRIVVLVVIDDPGPERVASRTHFGSQVAGPVVRRYVERALAYMGTAPTRRDLVAAR